MILGIPLEDLFLWLVYVVGAMGSVLLIAGIGWLGQWVVRWIEHKVNTMIGEIADHE